jgi:inner membrane protein
MLFWHLGASLWLFRWIFRDPKVDIRFLFLGAILPDLVDLPVGALILADRYATSELWFHSLLLPTLFMTAVLLLTRRGRRRRASMALSVAWLFHLLLDGMWLDQEVFLWPFFGDIPPGRAPFWPLAWERAMSDPWRWVTEAVGLAYLVWLWVSLGFGSSERRSVVWTTGRLPTDAAEKT